MSIRASLQQVLHVAPPLGMQHATNQSDSATSNATLSATICGKASSDAVLNATSGATVAQQSVKSDATLTELQREARAEWRRQNVIAMLEAAPETQRAVFADTDSDPHNVILAIAVRHPTGATCDMLIPKAKYDAWRLLELIERHGQTTH